MWLMWRTGRPSPAWVLRSVLGGLVMVALGTSACSYSTDVAEPEREIRSSVVLDRDGGLLTTLDAGEHREPVPLEEISPTLRDAVVAVEDERFYDHRGVDAKAVVRALTRNAEAGAVEEGGSTITQQYVRTALLEPDRSVERKLREAVLAWELERKLDKDEILERYLNAVYFGRGAYGAQAAARRYFGTDAADLDLAQSALLAGVLQAPEDLDPGVDPDAARERRDLVLTKMAEQGLVTEADAAAARSQDLGVVADDGRARYPAGHFVDRVVELVLSDPAFGDTEEQRRNLLYTGGLTIETSLDPRRQAEAEAAIAQVLTEPAIDPAAALVSVDPASGEVVAYVGGRDYFAQEPGAQFDLAGQARRQPGSAFKPFVFLAALESGVAPERTYPAPAALTVPQPDPQPPWQVENYDDRAFGSLDLVEATVFSVNTVYAQLVEDVGAAAVVEVARRMGITSPLEAVPSVALGSNEVTPLELTAGYTTLATGGLRVDPVLVTRVTDPDGNVLHEADRSEERVLDEDVAAVTTDVLRQVPERGTGVHARIGRPIAGKTGTSEGWRDAWFAGFTPELVTTVWVGYAQEPRPMVPPTTRITVTGGDWPARIWQLYQGSVLAETPVSPLRTPDLTDPEEAVALPDVVGMRGPDAATLLSDAGFAVRSVARPDGQYPPGTVLEQEPSPRSLVDPDAEVTLVLAGGDPADVAVPRVLGLSPDEARFWLEGAGFSAQVVVEAEPPPGDPARAGRVWKQAPSGEALVPEGSTVTLRVNPG